MRKVQILYSLPDFILWEVFPVAEQKCSQPGNISDSRLAGAQQKVDGCEQFESADANAGGHGLEQATELVQPIPRAGVKRPFFPILCLLVNTTPLLFAWV